MKNLFKPGRSAAQPPLLDVMTNWAATHLLIAAGKTWGAECQIRDAICENSGWLQRRIAGG
jgi:choline dehydrogenase-like flavoprotein